MILRRIYYDWNGIYILLPNNNVTDIKMHDLGWPKTSLVIMKQFTETGNWWLYQGRKGLPCYSEMVDLLEKLFQLSLQKAFIKRQKEDILKSLFIRFLIGEMFSLTRSIIFLGTVDYS